MRKGVIFLVPVPIGNLRDITLRAIDILSAVSLIACEDTRKTSFLLKHYQIPCPRLLSFHKFNERSREERLFAQLDLGADIAIVSDAGSPTISDPAQGFVAKAIQRDYAVQALPGATALIPALSISGFDTSAFQFVGFLPVQAKLRTQAIQQIRNYPYPTLLYESVHHLKATLTELAKALSPRRVAIVREISKLHEECIRKEISDLVEHYEITEKGEFVIVIEGCREQVQQFDEAGALKLLKLHLDMSSKDLAALISEQCHISKNQAYAFVLEQRN